MLPTQQRLVFERFFDEAGDMHLVVHAPFGARINRAFGLLLRKRFCRAFNFELQAAATEDAIVLSLGETHSFALEQLPRFLNSRSAEPALIQALLDAPLFATRWRWVATISLAVRRSRAGKKTPAPLLRMAAEDLISVVFPDQLACAENLSGEREIPDHPLVRQVLHDCLHEAMDLDGLVDAARAHGAPRARSGHARSAAAVVAGAGDPDGAAIRLSRRCAAGGAAHAGGGGAALARSARAPPNSRSSIRRRSPPCAPKPGRHPKSADELHDALMLLGVLTEAEAQALAPAGRLRFAAAAATCDAHAHRRQPAACCCWVAAEQLPMLERAYPEHSLEPVIEAPAEFRERSWESERAQRELLRGRLQATGPTTVAALAAALALPAARIEAALVALETEGSCCADGSRPAPTRRSGASAGCWRESIATRSARCAPRSSRCRAPISCASCSTGRA